MEEKIDKQKKMLDLIFNVEGDKPQEKKTEIRKGERENKLDKETKKNK